MGGGMLSTLFFFEGEKITEQTKAVFFENPQLLREKLLDYLQTPEKVEIYAQAAEKFYIAGGKMGLGFAATWSWRGFLQHMVFVLQKTKQVWVDIVSSCFCAWHYPLSRSYNKYSSNGRSRRSW